MLCSYTCIIDPLVLEMAQKVVKSVDCTLGVPVQSTCSFALPFQCSQQLLFKIAHVYTLTNQITQSFQQLSKWRTTMQASYILETLSSCPEALHELSKALMPSLMKNLTALAQKRQ